MTKDAILSLIPGANGEQADKFIKYYELLIEWNEKMNLTAITDEREVAEKHFADSLLPMELIPQNAKCIDVGTGAGFPGVPLMIMRQDITVTLLDSLNKRLIFLNEVIRALGLEGRAKTLHMRSEAAQNAMNRLCLEARLIEYPCAWGERYVIAAKKLAPTPKAYPRKAGMAAKNPL